jgi:NAD(P)-dependent dehydrogenase (short-subunit alcohol dehydrogenase family)
MSVERRIVSGCLNMQVPSFNSVGFVIKIDYLDDFAIQTMEKYGKLDILVSNAAINPILGPIIEVRSQRF